MNDRPKSLEDRLIGAALERLSKLSPPPKQVKQTPPPKVKLSENDKMFIVPKAYRG